MIVQQAKIFIFGFEAFISNDLINRIFKIKSFRGMIIYEKTYFFICIYMSFIARNKFALRYLWQ
ncbi:conserved hypothetical protein [Oenococcus oeni]|nr:conserved hypothetical protein [Oenococcus oeni]